jgi:hemerythrin-like domain-containing protein
LTRLTSICSPEAADFLLKPSDGLCAACPPRIGGLQLAHRSINVMLSMKITESLVAEHNTFLIVFDQIERVLPSLATPTELRTMASIVEGLLESHAKTETNLAYLALDHVLAHNGEFKRMHQDHHEIDDRLRKVHTAKTCAEARRLLKLALLASREHFQLEERSVFPLLERALQKETLNELGRIWLKRSSPEARAL